VNVVGFQAARHVTVGHWKGSDQNRRTWGSFESESDIQLSCRNQGQGLAVHPSLCFRLTGGSEQGPITAIGFFGSGHQFSQSFAPNNFFLSSYHHASSSTEMAPALNHPSGVTFIDESLGTVHVDAATYYGGGESFTRSRTYSHVRYNLLEFCSRSLWFL
jgi:hypothetical protein